MRDFRSPPSATLGVPPSRPRRREPSPANSTIPTHIHVVGRYGAPARHRRRPLRGRRARPREQPDPGSSIVVDFGESRRAAVVGSARSVADRELHQHTVRVHERARRGVLHGRRGRHADAVGLLVRDDAHLRTACCSARCRRVGLRPDPTGGLGANDLDVMDERLRRRHQSVRGDYDASGFLGANDPSVCPTPSDGPPRRRAPTGLPSVTGRK